MDTNGATTAVGNFNWIRVSTPNGFAILRGPYLQQVTDVSAVVVWTTRDLGAGAGALRALRWFDGHGDALTRGCSRRQIPGSRRDFYQYEAQITGLDGGNQVHLRHLHGRSGRDTRTG